MYLMGSVNNPNFKKNSTQDQDNFVHKPSPTLTFLPLEKMAAIMQMMFSDAISWMKCFVFWLKFHEVCS